MVRRLKRSHRRWTAIALAALLLVVVAWWGWVPPKVPEDCGLDRNAAWISVDWTSQPIDQDAVTRLAENATARELHYLFPFTTYVKADGSFSPSHAHAAEFVSRFRQSNQDTLLLAWIGVPLANRGGLGIDGWVDLADPAARQEIVAFCAQLVDEAGFSGVHLDAETVRNYDRQYLTLLQEVKDAIGPSRILSIAGNDWKPTILDRAPVVGGYKWSGRYWRMVADRVDQIAVMSYDSFTFHPALYRLWMREQVRGITKSLAGADVELLMGLSISRERTSTHRPRTENMQSGLAGICAGLSHQSRDSHPVTGVAIYAEWEADAGDWQTWEDWLQTSSVKNEQ